MDSKKQLNESNEKKKWATETWYNDDMKSEEKEEGATEKGEADVGAIMLKEDTRKQIHNKENIEETTEVKITSTIPDATQINIEKPIDAQEEAEVKAQTEPINVDNQQKVEKPAEKEPEQSIAELAVNKIKNKDDSKVENTIDTQSEQKEAKRDKEEANDGNKEEVVFFTLSNKMTSPIEKFASPTAKETRVAESNSSIPITEATPNDMIPPLQKIESTHVVELNPRASPQASEEAEASSPLKEKATKRKRRAIRKTINVVLDSQSLDEPTPTPRDRKPTQKRRRNA
ncbi:uncharacterized protein LOC131875075 [Cryptomeria japonica]|uniref:uncharacterized protein LOC131875075 n=1 Tax=Cryptomeria japonica TaxID=3369 RepID=UPI0027DA0B59|nr:uncharacterized protein LOC131875075 [Cryptomeria japonica]